LKWEIDDSRQIHSQIVDEIIKRIINGIYTYGEKIPSVRDLAIEAKVNPNTMQRALQELEEKQIIETKRTTGKFVTKNEKILKNLKQSSSELILNNFIKSMQDLGIDNKDIIKMIERELSV